MKENAERLDPAKIREEQERLELALSEAEKVKDQGAYMTPQEAVRFLIRLPVPFISDLIDVWQEFRLTRVWTPRMRGYIPNLNDPIERERQNRIRLGINAFGKEKSEGELLTNIRGIPHPMRSKAEHWVGMDSGPSVSSVSFAPEYIV